VYPPAVVLFIVSSRGFKLRINLLVPPGQIFGQ
jgi:hypothetical protein